MTQFLTQTGRIINIDSPFVGPDGTQYPGGWLRSLTPEERTAFGLTEVIEQPRPDERFYWVQDNGDGTFTSVEKDIDTLKQAKIDQAWALFDQKYFGSEVTVNLSSGRYNFGCDKDTIDNIMGINNMISRGLPVPNPRPFTPKRSMPIDVTHNDFGIIGFAIATQKDMLYTVYLTHKLNILQMTQQDFQAFLDYDITSGWDEMIDSLIPPVPETP